MHDRIADVMTAPPVCCPPDATVGDAARLMRDHDIGDVIVCEDDRLIGIVTDRDLVVRALAEGERAADRPLREICSQDLVTVSPRDDVQRAIDLMKERAVRRLPVCEGDQIVGIVALGDLAVDRDASSALGRISAAPPSH